MGVRKEVFIIKLKHKKKVVRNAVILYLYIITLYAVNIIDKYVL